MYLEFKQQNNILIITLIGELDHHSAEEVRNKVDDKIDLCNYNKVILNFSGVTFMDSSGIGVVIGRYKKLIRKDGSICITNVNTSVKRVFDLSGMFKIIKLYDNIEQAIQNM